MSEPRNLLDRVGGASLMNWRDWYNWEQLVSDIDDWLKDYGLSGEAPEPDPFTVETSYNHKRHHLVAYAYCHIAALLADNLRLTQENEAYRLELEPLRQRFYYLERDSKPYIEAKEAKEREEMLRRLGWRPKPWWGRWLGR